MAKIRKGREIFEEASTEREYYMNLSPTELADILIAATKALEAVEPTYIEREAFPEDSDPLIHQPTTVLVEQYKHIYSRGDRARLKKIAKQIIEKLEDAI